VVNHRSLIADHTSYWDNRAGFVSRVAMFLARVGKLEVALHQLKPGDTVLIDKEAIACGMRIGFVNDLVGLTWIFGLASLFLTGRKQLEPFGDFIRTHLSATTSNFGIELAKINVGERFLSMEPATITQVTYLALLVLLYFAARWIKEFWNGCGAAVLAQHNPIDVNIEILFAMCQSIAFSLGAWWLLNHAGVVLPPEWFALAGFVFGALWMFRLHRKVKFD